MIQAVYNAIIVKPFDEQETKYGNIIVPDLGKERNLSGTVVSVGPGQYSITGELLSLNFKNWKNMYSIKRKQSVI